MKVSFLVNPVFNGWGPKDIRLGGTEESVVNWSKKLAERGHQVTVYHNGEHGLFDGVEYRERDDYAPGDVTVNIKSPELKPEGKTWYLTNETDAAKHDLSDFYGVLLPSKWAVDNLNILHPRVLVLPHGYNAEDIHPQEKIPYQCLYASSPDRGLENLKQIWPIVVEQVPEATLIVTYGGYMEGKGVIVMGDVEENIMSQLFNTSEYWLHPASGGELYCMSGIKAQVAGAIPVYFPTMALKETVRHGVPCNNNEDFAQQLVSLIKNKDQQQAIRYKLKLEEYPDWERTTDILEGILKS